MSALAVRTVGEGPRVVLVHGGIGPELSWDRQLELAPRWTLVVPARRGYEPSPAAERQDFEADVEDLDALVEAGDHLVGFSYGGIAAAAVAARWAGEVRSLTLIEPALMALAGISVPPFPPESLDDREAHWAFLSLAGIERPEDSDAEAEIERLTRMARRARPPGEAEVDLAPIAAAGLPVLSVSGGRNPAFEAICDLVAEQTGGERLRLGDRPHAVQRTEGFNERLEDFLRRAEDAAGRTR